MKNFLNKKVLFAAVMSVGLVSTVSAQESTLENAIAQVVMVQGQQLLSEMGNELQKSIKDEIHDFSINTTFEWLSMNVTSKSKLVTEEVVQNNINADEE